MTPPIDLIQRRIANISVGSSTVRGQNTENTVTIARKYLQLVNLKDFSDANEDQLKRY